MHNHSSFVVQKQEVGAIHTEPDVMSKTETNEPRTHTQLIIFKKKTKTYEHHFMYSHFFMQVIFLS